MTLPDDPNSKPSLSEQIVELIRKVSMPGGVTIGGASALWYYFVQEDVFRTIAAAIIGVLLSYGAAILGPLHKGNQRRAKNLGKALDTSIDLVTDQLVATASGFDEKYLFCQASVCEALRLDGVPPQDGIFVPLLTEVFVPLEIDSSSISPGYKDTQDEKLSSAFTERRDLTIWDFLSKSKITRTFRQLAVLAWGGYGKTTLLKHIAFLYGTQQQPRNAPKLIPVLLVLRDYRDLLSTEDAPNLANLITHHHIPNLSEGQELQPPKGWAKKILQTGKALVMFDGFDEVGSNQRAYVARWLKTQMEQYSKSVFIVTSRPKAYRNQAPVTRLALSTSLWVQDFSSEQRQQFVTRWYECQERYANAGRNTRDVRKQASKSAINLLEQIEAQSELRDLAKNPLLLSMIVAFHRRGAGAELPKRKVELYAEICRLQLRDRARARNQGQCMTQCDAQSILQQIAFDMMQSHQERIENNVILQKLSDILALREETFSNLTFLQDVVEVSELLVQQEEEYEFAHLSFQEYLAAAYIAQTNQEQILFTHFEDDWWKPTILLYAGQVNPTKLIRELVNRGLSDLAYDCLKETTKRLDPELAKELHIVSQTVTEARYENLKTYLKNGDWKKADQETYRLMITTVGKEEGQYFSSDELFLFPHKELKTIDDLWVKHSNGQYGFSVQKTIYLECGGATNGEYHKRAFEKFGDAVSWRSNNFWKFDIQWDGSGPKGHLPFLKAGWIHGAIGRSLLSNLGL